MTSTFVSHLDSQEYEPGFSRIWNQSRGFEKDLVMQSDFKRINSTMQMFSLTCLWIVIIPVKKAFKSKLRVIGIDGVDELVYKPAYRDPNSAASQALFEVVIEVVS